jgi:hypothetical protein
MLSPKNEEPVWRRCTAAVKEDFHRFIFCEALGFEVALPTNCRVWKIVKEKWVSQYILLLLCMQICI